MAQPPRYQRKKDFTVDYGSETDHAALNSELDGAATSINALRKNLALIQRDDGKLAQGIVTADSVESDFADELSGRVSSGVQGALNDAKASALSATLAANAAETSRNASAGSATSSATSASAAASSASSAALSSSAAGNKAAESAASAANADASKDAAAASAAGAASSATNAAVAATNADLAKNNAANSASTAATSATNAANSASNSEASAVAAASAYDDFDRRFLGGKAADPTVDNDGQPLQVAAMYWNTSGNEMRIWNGTAWKTPMAGIPNDKSVTQAKLAPNVAGTGPSFKAYSTATQTLSLGITARLTLGAEFFDVAGAFANSKFQPAVAGYYQVNVRATFSATNMTTAFVDIYKNGALHERGTQFAVSQSAAVSIMNCIGCDTVYLDGVADYVELFGHANGSGTATCTYVSLSATLVRAA